MLHLPPFSLPHQYQLQVDPYQNPQISTMPSHPGGNMQQGGPQSAFGPQSPVAAGSVPYGYNNPPFPPAAPPRVPGSRNHLSQLSHGVPQFPYQSTCGSNNQSPNGYPPILYSPTVPGFYTMIDPVTGERQDKAKSVVDVAKVWRTDPADYYTSEPGVSKDELQRRRRHYQAYKDSMMRHYNLPYQQLQEQGTYSNGSALPNRGNFPNAQSLGMSTQGSMFLNTVSAPGSNIPVMPSGAPVSSRPMLQPNRTVNQASSEGMQQALKAESGGMGFDPSFNGNSDPEMGPDESLPPHTSTNLGATFGTEASLPLDLPEYANFDIDMFNGVFLGNEGILDEVANIGGECMLRDQNSETTLPPRPPYCDPAIDPALLEHDAKLRSTTNSFVTGMNTPAQHLRELSHSAAPLQRPAVGRKPGDDQAHANPIAAEKIETDNRLPAKAHSEDYSAVWFAQLLFRLEETTRIEKTREKKSRACHSNLQSGSQPEAVDRLTKRPRGRPRKLPIKRYDAENQERKSIGVENSIQENRRSARDQDKLSRTAKILGKEKLREQVQARRCQASRAEDDDHKIDSNLPSWFNSQITCINSQCQYSRN